MAETIPDQKITFSLSLLPKIAETLFSEGKGEWVWLFYGNIGVGKTTLIKEICRQLGVADHKLTSPTFSIINEYPSRDGLVYHFDFYRLKDESEILDLGVEEYLDSGNYCFIEWPERMEGILPRTYFKITLAHLNDNQRTIEFEKHG